MPTDDLLGFLKQLLTGTVVLGLAVVVLLLMATLSGSFATVAKTSTTDADTELTGFRGDDTAPLTEVFDLRGELLSISARDTSGRAYKFAGTGDSWVRTADGVDISSDDTWSVCTWAAVDSDVDQANASMTFLNADGDLLMQFDEGNWSAIYVDDTEQASFQVNVSASNPTSLTQVCVQHNASQTLQIWANNSANNSVTTTGDSAVAGGFNTTNFDGTLEETRGFDDWLTSSERQSLFDDPVGSLAGTNRTLRVYYDTLGDSEPIFFATARSMTVSNVTRVDGFDGQDLTKGTDYSVGVRGWRVDRLDGGRVAQSPAIWVDYTYSSAPGIGGTIWFGNQAFDLMSVGLLLIPTVVVVLLLIGALSVVDLGDIIGNSRRR